MFASTVEPPNKGHIGDYINSAVLSFMERLSSFRGSQHIGEVFFFFGPQSIIQCPFSVGPLSEVPQWIYPAVDLLGVHLRESLRVLLLRESSREILCNGLAI